MLTQHNQSISIEKLAADIAKGPHLAAKLITELAKIFAESESEPHQYAVLVAASVSDGGLELLQVLGSCAELIKKTDRGDD